MAEVEEVAQVLRVSLEGVQVAMQITGAFWHNGKDFLKVLWNVLHKEKLQGKTSMRDLLTRGGDLQLFQFPENAKEQIYKALKSYGVLFAELPDLNRKDGLTEVVFHAEAVPRVNDLIKNINAGTLIDMEQYLENAEPEAMQEQRDSFTENYQEEEKSLSETEKEEIVNRMKVLDAKDNPTQEDITIAKKLVIRETDKEYFTRIPYEREKFVWISKEDAVWFLASGIIRSVSYLNCWDNPLYLSKAVRRGQSWNGLSQFLYPLVAPWWYCFLLWAFVQRVSISGMRCGLKISFVC